MGSIFGYLSCSQLNIEVGGDDILMEFSDTVKPHTNWSRVTWKNDQTKITKFFDLLTNVTSLIDNNPTMIQECQFKQSKKKFNVLFIRLILNAKKNLQKHPQQVRLLRHDILLKNLQHHFFIVVQGPIILFPAIFPVLFHVWVLCKGLWLLTIALYMKVVWIKHLKAFKCPNVSVGEVATWVIKKAQHDAETDKLVGFVLPCDKEGMPLCDSFMATSFESMQH